MRYILKNIHFFINTVALKETLDLFNLQILVGHLLGYQIDIFKCFIRIKKQERWNAFGEKGFV